MLMDVFIIINLQKNKRSVVSLALKGEDYSHVKKFKNFLKDKRDDSVIKVNRIKRGDKIYEEARYVVCSIYLVEKLISLGCIPNKSKILKFPDKSLFKTESLVIDFIRGYIDGDGCLYKKHGVLGINVLGTYDFLAGLKEYFPAFTKEHKRDGIYQIDSGGKNADQIAMKLYGHATIYLDRKFKKFATLCRLYNAGEKSNNIGESCDANTEITSEITKGPEES